MKKLVAFTAFISVFSMYGCYHATIITGMTPTAETIEESFASCWVYGLVPPSTVAAAAQCPHGVAKVETQLSFINQLVGIITLGIYTPMEIKVTCAAKSSAMISPHVPDIVVESGSSDEQILNGFQKAADMAVNSGKPIYIEY